MTPATALAQHGLLLLADNERPALAQLVAGETIRGSWWGHPAGKKIYAAAVALGEHDDVTTAKLVDGKVTFVHRRLWPALVAIGSARAAWQTDGLDTAADLLAALDARGRVASDDPALDWDGKTRKEAFGAIEKRLLAAAWDEHTAKGSHRTVVERWANWAERHGVEPIDADAGRAALEAAAATLGVCRLPWQAGRTKGRAIR